MRLYEILLKLATDAIETPSSFPDVGPTGPGGGPPGSYQDKAQATPKMPDLAFPQPTKVDGSPKNASGYSRL